VVEAVELRRSNFDAAGSGILLDAGNPAGVESCRWLAAVFMAEERQATSAEGTP
jgi:hypothetical protein